MKIYNLFTSLGLIALLSSCTTQPKCTDELAKDIALELAKESLVTEIAYQKCLNLNYPLKYFIHVDDLKNNIRKEIRTGQSKSDLYTDIISNSKRIVNNLNPKIQNIRTSNKQEDLRKCTCEAILMLDNGNSADLIYSVQLTEDDETYVELQIVE